MNKLFELVLGGGFYSQRVLVGAVSELAAREFMQERDTASFYYTVDEVDINVIAHCSVCGLAPRPKRRRLVVDMDSECTWTVCPEDVDFNQLLERGSLPRFHEEEVTRIYRWTDSRFTKCREVPLEGIIDMR